MENKSSKKDHIWDSTEQLKVLAQDNVCFNCFIFLRIKTFIKEVSTTTNNINNAKDFPFGEIRAWKLK